MDISDNVVVTVTLQIKDNFMQRNSYEFLYLFDERLKRYPTDSAKLIRKLYKYYPCDNNNWNVMYDVNFEGALRTVENKSTGRNMLEFDDKVIYNVFYDTLSNNNIPLNKYEFCRNVYNINVQLDTTRFPLRINNFVFDERFLIHEDDKPYLFVQWFMQLLVANNGLLHNNTNFEIYFMNGNNKVYLIKKGGLTSSELLAIKDIEFSLLKE